MQRPWISASSSAARQVSWRCGAIRDSLTPSVLASLIDELKSICASLPDRRKGIRRAGDYAGDAMDNGHGIMAEQQAHRRDAHRQPALCPEPGKRPQ